MFEAKLKQGGVLKKVLDAIKELLNEATFDCSETGVELQAMDSSHVSLVNVNLAAEGFEYYRCDRSVSLGMNLVSLGKILKCSASTDVLTMTAADENADVVSFVFESANGDRVADFDMKLMNLDQEHLGIPETKYDCIIKMPSGDYARIVRDLSQFGESIMISCNKYGVKFTSTGDIGTGNIKLAQTSSADDEKPVIITAKQPAALAFAAKYLNSFAKAAILSDRVSLCMSQDVPLMVEFQVADLGYIRFYLAPKIEDEEN